MNVVLDTNVLVSALLRPQGVCGEILQLVVAGHVRLCVDERIIHEYRAGLPRPLFGFSPGDVEAVLEIVGIAADHIDPPPLSVKLPDESDVPFLEVAVEAGAILITGNERHFPPHLRCGVTLLPPAKFMARLRGQD